jgi:hypothetical protein
LSRLFFAIPVRNPVACILVVRRIFGRMRVDGGLATSGTFKLQRIEIVRRALSDKVLQFQPYPC